MRSRHETEQAAAILMSVLSSMTKAQRWRLGKYAALRNINDLIS